MSTYLVLDKREDWNFLEVGDVKVDAIRNEVLEFYDEWLISTTRQQTFETHQSTFVFEMLGLDYAHGLSMPGVCYIKNNLKIPAAAEEIAAIYSTLEGAINGKVVRAEFVSMSPNSRIRTHKDRSDLLYVSRRFHVPIRTNPDVVFVTGNETKHLEQGKAYELNNIKYHSVHNRSLETRIHLIVDVLPDEYCNRLEYRHEVK